MGLPPRAVTPAKAGACPSRMRYSTVSPPTPSFPPRNGVRGKLRWGPKRVSAGSARAEARLGSRLRGNDGVDGASECRQSGLAKVRVHCKKRIHHRLLMWIPAFADMTMGAGLFIKLTSPRPSRRVLTVSRRSLAGGAVER